MPQIVYDGDEPFRFGYGGRSYIVPPKQGGRWEIVYEPYTDEDGFSRNRRVLTKVGESARNFIDVPAGAIAHLFRAEIRKLHKNKIRVISDAMSQVQSELDELKAERAQLESERAELAEKMALLEVGAKPKTTKAKR